MTNIYGPDITVVLILWSWYIMCSWQYKWLVVSCSLRLVSLYASTRVSLWIKRYLGCERVSRTDIILYTVVIRVSSSKPQCVVHTRITENYQCILHTGNIYVWKERETSNCGWILLTGNIYVCGRRGDNLVTRILNAFFREGIYTFMEGREMSRSLIGHQAGGY